jgi:hypothetical protein
MRRVLLLALLVFTACGGKHEGIATSPQQSQPSTPTDDESGAPGAPGPAEPQPDQPGDTEPPTQGPTPAQPPPAQPPQR